MENLGVKNIFYRVSKFGRLLKTRETRHPKGDPTCHWVGPAKVGQGSAEPWWGPLARALCLCPPTAFEVPSQSLMNSV